MSSGEIRASSASISGWKWRAGLLALLVALAAAAPLNSAAEAASQRKVRLGNAFDFNIEGNPSTGYKWQINTGASSGLDLVKVVSLGYASATRKSDRVVVGAPAPFVFRITCIKAGSAHLVFDYVGPTGKRSDKTHETWVRCE